MTFVVATRQKVHRLSEDLRRNIVMRLPVIFMLLPPVNSRTSVTTQPCAKTQHEHQARDTIYVTSGSLEFLSAHATVALRQPTTAYEHTAVLKQQPRARTSTNANEIQIGATEVRAVLLGHQDGDRHALTSCTLQLTTVARSLFLLPSLGQHQVPPMSSERRVCKLECCNGSCTPGRWSGRAVSRGASARCGLLPVTLLCAALLLWHFKPSV
jgi:hypothetical protein